MLNRPAPLKVKYTNQSFINKTLSKAGMTFPKNPNNINKLNYSKYRNYCTNLFKKKKKLYCNNLDTKLIADNMKFCNTVKPLFPDKHFNNNKITLLEGDEIISTDSEVAETFNNFSLMPLKTWV